MCFVSQRKWNADILATAFGARFTVASTIRAILLICSATRHGARYPGLMNETMTLDLCRTTVTYADPPPMVKFSLIQHSAHNGVTSARV